MDRGVWQATILGFAKSQTQLSNYNFKVVLDIVKQAATFT